MSTISAIDLGRMSYAEAYRVQSEHVERVIASREGDAPQRGVILLVEHDPVITVSRRPGVADHVLASADTLRAAGVEVAQTDRGGDVTYHGPGQLVVYPIIDLNAHRLRIVDYIRLLESAIIDALASFDVHATTDPGATGVWVDRSQTTPRGESEAARMPDAKVAAIGVRVRRWVSMHGLSLNVDPALEHFNLIVPCGLHGRGVTSLREVLGVACPSMESVKSRLVGTLRARLEALVAI